MTTTGLDRWILGHQIGLAAHFYAAFLASPSDAELKKRFKEERGRLFDLLKVLLAEYGWPASPSVLTTLPPSVLWLLHSVGGLPSGLSNAVKGALDVLFPGGDSNDENSPPSAVNTAVIFARHLSHGVATPKRLARLGIHTLGFDKFWKSVEATPDLLKHLAEQGDIVRGPHATTNQKAEAVAAWMSALRAHAYGGTLAGCAFEQLENALYHQLFAWPLLTIGIGPEVATSIPIGVDAFLDSGCEPGKDDAEPFGDSAFNLSEPGKDDPRTWKAHLLDAVEKGKFQWRAQHGNHGIRFRDAVSSALVRFDFSCATRIMVRVMPAAPIALTDASASGFLAQIVLSRLRGRGCFSTSALTGTVGAQRVDGQGNALLDWKLGEVGGLEKKIKYVWMTGLFERVIIPLADPNNEVDRLFERLHQQDESGKKRWTQTAEVLRAAHLSTAADIMQEGSWRRHQYFRLPDVEWAVHGDGNFQPPGRNGTTVLDALRESQEPVVTLEDASALDVALALSWIDGQHRWDIGSDKIENGRKIRIMPPGLSWTFIRAVDYEQDGSFWQVLWDSMGGSNADFEKFRASPTPDLAADRLLAAMNCFEPTRDNPSLRAPDVLVIAGYGEIEESSKTTKNPRSRPLHAEKLIGLMAKRLEISPVRNAWGLWNQALGRTRIICLPNDQDWRDQHWVDIEGLEQNLNDVLQRLAIFRFGFTQQQASLLLDELNIGGKDVRGTLDALVERDLLRRQGAAYHIPWHHRQPSHVGLANYKIEFARTMRAAGISFAPYVVDRPVAGMAYDEAFEVLNIHEADAYFATAAWLFERNGPGYSHPEDEASRTRWQQVKLTRFARPPSWSTINGLIKMHLPFPELWEMVSGLLEDSRSPYGPNSKTKYPNHPAHLCTAADIATKIAQGSQGGLIEGRPAEEIIIALYEQAIKNCPLFEGETEYNHLRTRCYYSHYLASNQDRCTQFAGRLKALDEDIVTMRDSWDRDMLTGDWVERWADGIQNEDEAVEAYGDALRCVPQWYQLWIKWIGAGESIAGRAAQQWLSTPPEPNHITDIAVKGPKGFKKNMPIHVLHRWKRGAARLLEVSRANQKASSSLTRLLDHVKTAIRMNLSTRDEAEGDKGSSLAP